MEVVVSGSQSARHQELVGFVEVDEGHAHASPAALNGGKGLRVFGDEGLLLVGSELDDSVAIFLSRKSGEDSVVEAEVGVVHVGAFDGSG